MTDGQDRLTELLSVKDNADCLFSGEAVRDAIRQQAERITQDYQDKHPVLVVVMNGGLVFAGQLVTHLDFPLELDYCHATRYRGDTRGAEIAWLARPQTTLRGRHVIIVDDILDEGHTLQCLVDEFTAAGAASVRSAVLLEKLHTRKATPGMVPDYCELKAPDRYLFGFGMDYHHYWRNSDGIYALGE